MIAISVAIARLYAVRIYNDAAKHQQAVLELHGFVRSRAAGKPTIWTSLARKWIHPHAFDKSEVLLISPEWPSLRKRLNSIKDSNGIECIQGEVDSLSQSEARLVYGSPELNQVILRVNGLAEPGVFSFIASKPKLKTLWIMSPIDAEMIDAISKNPSLENLTVDCDSLTREQIMTITHTRTVKNLGLNDAAVDASLVNSLKKMPQLRGLTLEDSRLTNEAIEEMSRLNLTTLSITGRQQLPTSIEVLSRNPLLKRLTIEVECQRTPNDIASFIDCSALEKLILSKCVIDDESLHILSTHPTLKTAAFTCDVPDEVAQAFVDAMPDRTLTLYGNGIRTFTSTKKSPATPMNP